MLKYGGTCEEKLEYAWKREHMQIHNDGIPWYKAWWIEATVNAETYYIYFADCGNNLSKIIDRDSLIFSFDLNTQEGGHFQKGEEWLLTIHYLFGVLTALAYIPFMKEFYVQCKKGFGEMNYPFMMINVCIILKVISTILEIVELEFLASTGHASDVMSFIAQITNYLS